LIARLAAALVIDELLVCVAAAIDRRTIARGRVGLVRDSAIDVDLATLKLLGFRRGRRADGYDGYDGLRRRDLSSLGVLAPDALGFGGPAPRQRGMQLSDERIGLPWCWRRQRCGERVDFGREGLDVLWVLLLGPRQ
jgi:hypothetical protein